MTTQPPVPRPCQFCPYRRDVPSGVWSEEEYAKLPPYDRPTYAQPTRLFRCHVHDRDSDQATVCGGWAGCHDGDHMLALRIAHITKEITLETAERSGTMSPRCRCSPPAPRLPPTACARSSIPARTPAAPSTRSAAPAPTSPRPYKAGHGHGRLPCSPRPPAQARHPDSDSRPSEKRSHSYVAAAEAAIRLRSTPRPTSSATPASGQQPPHAVARQGYRYESVVVRPPAAEPRAPAAPPPGRALCPCLRRPLTPCPGWPAGTADGP